MGSIGDSYVKTTGKSIEQRKGTVFFAKSPLGKTGRPTYHGFPLAGLLPRFTEIFLLLGSKAAETVWFARCLVSSFLRGLQLRWSWEAWELPLFSFQLHRRLPFLNFHSVDYSLMFFLWSPHSYGRGGRKRYLNLPVKGNSVCLG